MARIFFFTSLSAFRSNARTRRILAAKETPPIMELPRAFNEEPPLTAAKRELLLGQGLRRIMAGENFSRIRRNAPCLQKNFPKLKLPRCSPRPKDGACERQAAPR